MIATIGQYQLGWITQTDHSSKYFKIAARTRSSPYRRIATIHFPNSQRWWLIPLNTVIVDQTNPWVSGFGRRSAKHSLWMRVAQRQSLSDGKLFSDVHRTEAWHEVCFRVEFRLDTQRKSFLRWGFDIGMPVIPVLQVIPRSVFFESLFLGAFEKAREYGKTGTYYRHMQLYQTPDARDSISI